MRADLAGLLSRCNAKTDVRKFKEAISARTNHTSLPTRVDCRLGIADFSLLGHSTVQSTVAGMYLPVDRNHPGDSVQQVCRPF